MPREKEVSTRLIRPTIANIDVVRLMEFVDRWDNNWDQDASIKVFDEGIAQYMLTDPESHYKYLAALVLGKASLRCSLVTEEPTDILDENGSTITLETNGGLNKMSEDRLDRLKAVLGSRGFRFAS